MNFKLILALLLLFSLSTSALTLKEIELADISKAIDRELPTPEILFGNQKLNINIQDDSKTLILGIETENNQIKSFTKQELTEPTLNIYTDLETLNKIVTTEDPQQTLLDSISEKKITYEAVGIVNKLKFGLINLGLKIFT